MAIQNRVVVYGSSLVMASVGACLVGLPQVDVIRVLEPLSGLRERLSGLDPAIVIFDRTDTLARFPIELILVHPQRAYLSLDLDRGICTLITGRTLAPVSDVTDLTNLIQSLVEAKLDAPAAVSTNSTAAPEPPQAALQREQPIAA